MQPFLKNELIVGKNIHWCLCGARLQNNICMKWGCLMFCFGKKFGEIINCHVNNTYVCKFDLLFGDLIYNKMILCVHMFIT
jgi:hypothetical protein